MRRALKRLAAAALALVLAVVAAAAAFLFRPELIITSRTASAALSRLGSAYAPRWSSLAFTASSAGRWRHRYTMRARDICADGIHGEFSACAGVLDLTAVIAYSRRGPRVEILENATVEGGTLSVDLRRRVAGAGAPPPVSLFLPPVRTLRVDIPRLRVRSADGDAQGRFSAALTPGKRRPLAVDAEIVTRGAGGVRRVKAALTADTDLFDGGPPTFVDALARAEVRGLGRASFRARCAGAGCEMSGDLDIAASTGPVAAVRLTSCRGRADASKGEFACRYEAVPARRPLEGGPGALKNFAGTLHASGARRDRRFTASLKAEADPLTAWYALTGGAEARLGGRLGGPLETLSVEAHAVLNARFEDLVALLRETDYAVPAPLQALSGPVSLSLESRGDPRSAAIRGRYVLTTDLAGARQRLKARAGGIVEAARAFSAERSFAHSGDVLLQEVALELPRLAVGPAPKVVMDPRIRTDDRKSPAANSSVPAPGGASPSFPLRSRVMVRTEKPLVLFSNLAKEPVPADLELVATYPPAAAGGTVSVRKFDVELFRRNATVDHFNVALASGSMNGELEGLVLYKTPLAAISIHILGTTQRPRVELTSVPPLKREDIISLLIFGKNPDELDPDQTSSVSNTETALQSRAFGLASLYLFGATPIEHVGYDPATKTTSVKLRLPGGANLIFGSDFDQSRQLSVRKSLAPHWAIQSEIIEQGQQSKAATTFLEWFNRY